MNRGLLDAKVESYEKLNDGSFAEDHIFVVRIWCERTYTYAIRRSAAALAQLNVALRKRFPRAELQELPIPVKRRTGGFSRKMSFVVTDELGSYKAAIERWLRELLSLAQVVGSEEMVSWLADEGDTDDLVTEVDHALEDEAVQRVTVRHGCSHSLELRVPRSHSLVWSFASRPRDIAFSLEKDGEQARTYERVPSHERLFQGVWEHAGEDVDVDAPAATLKVTFGNEYAKWRDKKVFYQIAVLSPRARDLARRRHRERLDADAEREAHREALERVALKLSHRTPIVDDDDDVSRCSVPTEVSEDAEVRGMPRREIEAIALAASKKVAALTNALALAEQEAARACSERDTAIENRRALLGRAADAEKRADQATKALAREKELRTLSSDEARTAKAELIEARFANDQAAETVARLDAECKQLQHQRDLLAQAARGYKDSAELARGDARRARETLTSGLKSAPRDDNLDELGDDDDDLLKRVDALQSRIDSELSHVENNDNKDEPPPTTSSPRTKKSRAANKLRRHDIQVPPGYGPGDDLPFHVEGMDLSVVVPAGLRPGDTFTIELR